MAAKKSRGRSTSRPTARKRTAAHKKKVVKKTAPAKVKRAVENLVKATRDLGRAQREVTEAVSALAGDDDSSIDGDDDFPSINERDEQ
jgi:hypothetical protein